jgi:hypothetical protein
VSLVGARLKLRVTEEVKHHQGLHVGMFHAKSDLQAHRFFLEQDNLGVQYTGYEFVNG